MSHKADCRENHESGEKAGTTVDPADSQGLPEGANSQVELTECKSYILHLLVNIIVIRVVGAQGHKSP